MANYELIALDETNKKLLAPTSTDVGVLVPDALINSVIVGRSGGGIETCTAVGRAALDSNTTGVSNTAVGDNALTANVTGLNNTAMGKDALLTAAGATDDNCTAFGKDALKLMNATSSGGNTAVGASALAANTTGVSNTAVGRSALSLNTTGIDNIGMGRNALSANTTGVANIGIGNNCLINAVTGINNVALGHGAMAAASGTTDDNCVAIGHGALDLMDGSVGSNVAIGKDAGNVITTGTENTLLGTGADTSANSSADQIVLGSGVTGIADDAITLGNNTRAITCNYGTDETWDAPSDGRMKNVVGKSTLGLSFINRLECVEFYHKPVEEWPEEWGVTEGKNTTKRILGMIAQDVKAAMDAEKETVWHGWDVNEKTGQQMLGSSALVYPLVNALQEISRRLEELEH